MNPFLTDIFNLVTYKYQKDLQIYIFIILEIGVTIKLNFRILVT